jgi:hypothetical protein
MKKYTRMVQCIFCGMVLLFVCGEGCYKNNVRKKVMDKYPLIGISIIVVVLLQEIEKYKFEIYYQ